MAGPGQELERGRDAYARRSWGEASKAFTRADEQQPLEPDDLYLLAQTALMLGRDDDSNVFLERAHRGYLERGETLRAARCACWICLNFASRGAVGPAGGWLATAQRLLDQEPGESAERGYVLLPMVFRHEAAGDFEAGAAVAAEAAAIGERFGDPDLFAVAVHAQGRMLIGAGKAREGLTLLDEAMVTVTTAPVSPFIVGIVYCGVILSCQEVFEVGRAREWTLALTRWVAEQPDIVAFTGRCYVHRAEILQLGGSWRDALEEARRAGQRLLATGNPAAGVAHYRQAELLRLLGDFEAAETTYREASRLGWEPQPGLAQLRLAQGQRDAAVSSIRRALAESSQPLKRAGLLSASVEIMLAAGKPAEAAESCNELAQIAETYESPMLRAMLAYARGASDLAAGRPQPALVQLREAWRMWQELDAPYEIARTRALVAQACRALGDEESAALELEAAREVFAELGAAPDLGGLEASMASVRVGTHGLSRRELEVLRLVAAGKSNREIAATLVISEHTVARHLQNIFAKLGLSSRTAATAFAFEHHLV